MMKPRPIDAASLSDMLATPSMLALIDVRDPVEVDRGHIFGMTNLPRPRIEYRIMRLVRDADTAIVVYCDGESGRAELAASRLSALGYTDVAWLDGGIAEWQKSGGVLASGNNVPSKKFGEQVHHDKQVPSIRPEALQHLLEQHGRVAICDVRTPEEHSAACVPGAISMPSFDIAQHAYDLAQNHDMLVLHCAGRTRGIIATRTLLELGLKNVVALENGTIGWCLAGLSLERGASSSVPRPSAASVAYAAEAARVLADSAGVARVDCAGLRALMSSPHGNHYVFDVRGVIDYRAGHVPGSVALPGGQAVQRADDFIALRSAPIVLLGDRGSQANLTAVWLKRMGYPDVSVLAGGIDAWRAAGGETEDGDGREAPMGWDSACAQARFISADALARRLAHPDGVVVLDVDYSRHYRKAHVPQAQWLPRGWLEARMPRVASDRETPIVLTSVDGMQSIYAASTLGTMGYRQVFVLEGGVRAWVQAGQLVERGDLPPQDDELLPPYQRGEEAMRDYIRWEKLLVA